MKNIRGTVLESTRLKTLLFLSKISVSVLHLRYLLSKICLEKLSYGHILKLFLYEKCYLAK